MVSARYRVLLVEDLPADAALVCRHLERAGVAEFEIEHVTDLASATTAISARVFDVILTDLNLPDSDGAETVTQLRGHAAETPIVVLTGTNDHEMRLEVLKRGADDFLSKSGEHTISLASGLSLAAQRGRVYAQIRALVERNADGAIVVDEVGEILFVNVAASQLLGASPSELIGRSFGFPLEGEGGARVQILNRDGEVRVGELRTSALQWDGRLAYLASVRDVSDRLRTEQLEGRLVEAERLASVGQMAAGVAHLINNPASFIQANSALLKEEVDDLEAKMSGLVADVRERAGDAAARAVAAALGRSALEERCRNLREMADDCITGIQRISAIVRDLGGFARLGTGEIERADIADIARDAHDLIRSSIRDGVHVDLDLQHARLIPMDRPKMIQVVVNLLLNAVRAVEVEGARAKNITLATRQLPDGAQLTVEDSGCGISEVYRRKVFQPFFTTHEDEGGRGLGLSLAFETVRTHGGELTFDTELGRGTRFDVFIPEESGLGHDLTLDIEAFE